MSTTNTSTPPNAPSGVFVSTLSAMHGGKVLEDLDDALRELTQGVNNAQKKGTITLELTVTPNGVGVGDTPLFKVKETIKVKKPVKPRQEQTFFADADNNLTRRNPHQEDIRFTVRDGGKAEAKTESSQSKAANS